MSGRGEKELISFVDDKKWKDVEPVSKWTAPNTIQSVHNLTLKAPITTVADDIHKYFFIVFQRK